jgi:HK97 family phage portal protein
VTSEWDGTAWAGETPVLKRTAAPVRPVMIGVPDTGWGGSVSAITALGLSSVWRCLDILSNGVSQLPWREVRGNLELPLSRIVQRPLSFATRREWVSYVVAILALYDVAYLLKVGGTDSEGVPSGLLPIDPSQVMPTSVNAMVSPFVDNDWYMVGRERVHRDDLVIIRRSPTPGVTDATGGLIRLARTAFAANLAAEGYASRYWQNGGPINVALESELHLNQVEADEISARWAERRSQGPDHPPVMSGGIHAKEFGADPMAASATEARREMDATVGRYFGIPTAILNAPAGDSETYTSTESQGMYLLTYTLRNYIGALEDAISDQLPGGRRMAMTTRVLTRGTQLAEAQALQLLTGNKAVMDVDEARDLLDLPPIESPNTLNPPAPVPAIAAPGGPGNGDNAPI